MISGLAGTADNHRPTPSRTPTACARKPSRNSVGLGAVGCAMSDDATATLAPACPLEIRAGVAVTLTGMFTGTSPCTKIGISPPPTPERLTPDRPSVALIGPRLPDTATGSDASGPPISALSVGISTVIDGIVIGVTGMMTLLPAFWDHGAGVDQLPLVCQSANAEPMSF